MSARRILVLVSCCLAAAAGCSSGPKDRPTRPKLSAEDPPDKDVQPPPWYKPSAEYAPWPLGPEPKYGTPEWQQWCALRYESREVVRLADSAPTIDGKLDDPAWKGTEAKLPFLSPNGEPASPGTTVCLAYDKDNLYVTAQCEELYTSKLQARSAPKDAFARSDDHFELMLAPDWKAKTHPILWFLVNSKGAVAEGRDSDTSWDPGMKAAAHVQERAWSIEVAIPLSAFGVKADELWGQVWACRLIRHRRAGGADGLSSWTRILDPERGTVNWGHVIFRGVKPEEKKEAPKKEDEKKEPVKETGKEKEKPKDGA